MSLFFVAKPIVGVCNVSYLQKSKLERTTRLIWRAALQLALPNADIRFQMRRHKSFTSKRSNLRHYFRIRITYSAIAFEIKISFPTVTMVVPRPLDLLYLEHLQCRRHLERHRCPHSISTIWLTFSAKYAGIVCSLDYLLAFILPSTLLYKLRNSVMNQSSWNKGVAPSFSINWWEHG